MHILPSVFANLPLEEKAFVIASIDIKTDADIAEQKKIEREAKKARSRKR